MIHRMNVKKATVYLSCTKTDMRKSINGLAAIVQSSFELDPFTGALFVFCNRNKDKIKILQLLRHRNNCSYSDINLIPIKTWKSNRRGINKCFYRNK